MSIRQSKFPALIASGLAAILASACCLGPMLLVMLGLSGASLGNLQALAPYRPIFLGVALVSLFFAWRRIYRPAAECRPTDICAAQQTKQVYKAIFWLVATLVLGALTFPYFARLFY
jgi:mercuric ion transport protein